MLTGTQVLTFFQFADPHRFSRHDVRCHWQQPCFPRLVLAGTVEVTRGNGPDRSYQMKGAAQK